MVDCTGSTYRGGRRNGGMGVARCARLDLDHPIHTLCLSSFEKEQTDIRVYARAYPRNPRHA